MPTDVVMPQLGESIAEGTIVRWLKKVGETVQRDEPLLEISTDKVDAEIPSPASGVLIATLANEGDTVSVNSVIAQLGEAGEAPAAPAADLRDRLRPAVPRRQQGRLPGADHAADDDRDGGHADRLEGPGRAARHGQRQAAQQRHRRGPLPGPAADDQRPVGNVQ